MGRKLERDASDVRLEIAIADILNQTKAIVFIDGLDETPYDQRETIERSIVALREKLRSSKIILTCRSGDFNTTLPGFRLVELCPFTPEQIRTVLRKWLRADKEFFDRLKDVPYADLANRPLFLCQLIVVFQNSGDLPEKLASIYRAIVRLALEEWDRQHHIKRRSRYAGFLTEEQAGVPLVAGVRPYVQGGNR